MKWLEKVVQVFDRLADLFLEKATLEEWRKELNSEFKSYSSPGKRFVYEAFDSIDTKTTAVLQHVSIMIAVSGVLFTQAMGAIRIVFGIEMMIYIFLTLFCLRFLMQQYRLGDDDMWEVARRELLLGVTTQLAFLTSAFLIVTVAFELMLIK